MTDAADAPAPSSIRGGNVLHGKYRLERELGRGAMGTVWSALHLSLDQRVAIKVISSEYVNSDEAIQRFHTEAKAAAKLRSRYVVQVYDDGETPEGLPYIVMEYLEGESLEDRITREGDIPLAEAVRIAAHVGRALSRAHARGIVHRDLKPANIFITRNEEDDMGWVAKVLDFGIAKLDDNREISTTKTGTVLGTPLFMSAEQVRGASTVDARADLYSLGMVFYNMITGGYAFEGSSFGDLLVSICTDPLPRLGDRAPWASAALEKWFQRACARDLDQRFQSADEMIDELHAAANLSFDGRMSFVEENSGLTQLAVSERALQTFWASDTAGEANNTQAIAATHHASELATNTGDASVHTIPGIPEKRRWLVPALMGGAVLVLGAAFIWFTTSGDADAANVRALELSAASELSESGATRSPKDATLPLASSKTLERVKADIATGDKKSAIAEQEAKAAETSDAKSRFKSRAETKSARAESVVKASTKSSKLSVKPKKPPVATPKAVTGKSQSAELDIGF